MKSTNNCKNCRYSTEWNADMPCIGCFDYVRWETPDEKEKVIPPKVGVVKPDMRLEILDFADTSNRWIV